MSIIKGFLAMFGYVAVQYMVNFIVLLISIISNQDVSFGSTLAIAGIAAIVSTIGTVILAGRLLSDKNIVNKNYENKIITKKQLVCILLIIVGFILIRNSVFFEMMEGFEGLISEEEINLIMNNSTPGELVATMGIFVLQAIIIAPIFEEFFFRGIIFKGFLNKYSTKPLKAIIWSGIIFGIVHLNIPQGINAFFMGMILASIYYYTKDIRLAIFAHFVNNFLVFIPSPTSIIFKIVYIAMGLYLIKKGISELKVKKEINY